MRLRDLLPFASLNLRWNPFGEVPEASRGALTVPLFDVDAEAARLAEPGHAIELLGEHGRGKSMHLRALQERFRDMPVTRVDPGQRPQIPHAAVVFIDESQRLSARIRRRLFQRKASFALATHESHQVEFRRASLEGKSVIVSSADPAHLRAVVTRRIEWARRAPGPLPTVPIEVLDDLLSRFGHDARAIEEALYSHFQGRCHGEV